MKESNPTYYDEIVNDGKCCEYWSDAGNEYDWNYGGSPAMNCDWFCHNCPDCDNNPDAFECIMIRLNSEDFSKFFLCQDILFLTFSYESTYQEVQKNAKIFSIILEYS